MINSRKIIIKTLKSNELEYFKRYSNVHTFYSATEIIYQGQIPMAAYILIKGNITLLNNRKGIQHVCECNQLIGFYEIYNNKPFSFTANIASGTTVLILDRTAIKEIKANMENKKITFDFTINELMA